MPAKPCLNVRKKPSHIVVDDARVTEDTNVSRSIRDENGVTFDSSKHGKSKNNRITIKLKGQKATKDDVPPPDGTLAITLTDPVGDFSVPMPVAYVDDPNDRKKPRRKNKVKPGKKRRRKS